jgi:hypothetical protein
VASRRHRRFGLACIIGGAALAVVLSGTDTASRSTIRIWKVGSPHTGAVPDTQRPFALSWQSRERGAHLSVEAFPAQGFARVFADALSRNAAPDIIVVNNMGVIEGITLERFRVAAARRPEHSGFEHGNGLSRRRWDRS